MWTLLFAFACSNPSMPELTSDGIKAKNNLAQALKSRDPAQVGIAAQEAANWEGQDQALDHLLGDALANVLMHVDAGLSLLVAEPNPQSESWQNAFLAATARSGDTNAMDAAWKQTGRVQLDFSNPVVNSMVQRLKMDPRLGIDQFEDAIQTCMVIDAQPPVGRSALEYPVSPDLIKIAPWVGADAVYLARPRAQTDPDPTLGIGPVQCAQKVVLDEWPRVIGTTLTVAMASGNRKLYLDIKQTNDEQWSYATSDPVAGGHWIQAMHLVNVPSAESQIRSRFNDGLWAQPATDDR